MRTSHKYYTLNVCNICKYILVCYSSHNVTHSHLVSQHSMKYLYTKRLFLASLSLSSCEVYSYEGGYAENYIILIALLFPMQKNCVKMKHSFSVYLCTYT